MPTEDPSPPPPARPRPDLSALRMDRSGEAAGGRRPRRWIGWSLGALLTGGALVLLLMREPIPGLSPRVETATVTKTTPARAAAVLTATGYTYARRRAAVGAKIVGRVVEIRVEEGDHVGAGDVIAVLDSDDLAAQARLAGAELAEARARLKDARREAGRQRSLLAEGITSQARHDAAQTALEVAVASEKTALAALEAARAQLDDTVIRSPIDGVVVERNIEVGEMVAPGGFTSQQSTGAIVRIADLDSLEVEADINESYIARLRIGQPAAVAVDAVHDTEYHGRLRQVVPTADRQKAVVKVKVTIQDRDPRLVPDMSCTVTFFETGTPGREMEGGAVVLAPEEAVLDDGGRPHVFVLEGKRARRREVRIGERKEGSVVIISGLRGGETVITEGSRALEDGDRVRASGAPGGAGGDTR